MALAMCSRISVCLDKIFVNVSLLSATRGVSVKIKVLVLSSLCVATTRFAVVTVK